MGYTYEIQYRQGKENVVAGALSRVTNSQLLQITLSQANYDLFDALSLSWSSDPRFLGIIKDLETDSSSHPNFTYMDNILRHKGKLVVGNDQSVKTRIF